MDKKLLNLKIYIEKSKYRTKIIKLMGNEAKTPTQLAQKLGITLTHASDVLQRLKKKNIVECINEEKTKGRLYRLTNTGIEVKNMIMGGIIE